MANGQYGESGSERQRSSGGESGWPPRWQAPGQASSAVARAGTWSPGPTGDAPRAAAKHSRRLRRSGRMTELIQDLRYAARNLAKQPALALAAVGRRNNFPISGGRLGQLLGFQRSSK